jgi:competence protein ComEA
MMSKSNVELVAKARAGESGLWSKILRAHRVLAESAWARTTARGAAVVLGVALLALVGSGRMARWLAPAPSLGIAVAQAAPPPVLPTVDATSAAVGPAPSVAVVPSPSASSLAAVPIGEPQTDGDPSAVAPEAGDGGAPTPGVAADGKVILNLATEEDLKRLPGIGRSRAQAILALRERLKKFSRVEDLLKVKGIGRKGLARLRPLIRVD